LRILCWAPMLSLAAWVLLVLPCTSWAFAQDSDREATTSPEMGSASAGGVGVVGREVSSVLSRGRYDWDDYAKRGEELLAEAGLVHDTAERVHLVRRVVSCYPHTPAAEKAWGILRGLVAAETHEPQVNVTDLPLEGQQESGGEPDVRRRGAESNRDQPRAAE